MIDGGRVGHRFPLIRSRANCFGQDVSVHWGLVRAEPDRVVVIGESSVNAWGSGGGGRGHVLEGIAVQAVWVMGDGKQLLSLLLLERPHLVFKHFALKETLAFMLKTLELDALSFTRQKEDTAASSLEDRLTADISDILVPSLAACVIQVFSAMERETSYKVELTESARSRKAGGLCLRPPEGGRLSIWLL